METIDSGFSNGNGTESLHLHLNPNVNLNVDVVNENNENFENISLNAFEMINITRARFLHYPDFTQIEAVRIPFVILFLIELVLGTTGNILCICVVYQNKTMHSAVNFYIVNLSISDFLVSIFVAPSKLFQLTAEAHLNVLNNLWCTVLRYMETILVFTSVLTLVAICIERYYAIAFPVQARIHPTKSRVRFVLFAVWAIPLIIASPNLIPGSVESHFMISEYGSFTRLFCFDGFSISFRYWYFIFLFFFIYVLPVFFIGITCFLIMRCLFKKMPVQADRRTLSIEKTRRKVAKMVVVVVFGFIICWSPYFIVTIITQIQAQNSFLYSGHYFFTMLSINFMAILNSCVNPLIFYKMSSKFRSGFKKIFKSIFCFTDKHDSSNNSSQISHQHQRVMAQNMAKFYINGNVVNNYNQPDLLEDSRISLRKESNNSNENHPLYPQYSICASDVESNSNHQNTYIENYPMSNTNIIHKPSFIGNERSSTRVTWI